MEIFSIGKIIGEVETVPFAIRARLYPCSDATYARGLDGAAADRLGVSEHVGFRQRRVEGIAEK